jgi:hypothetical protein
LRHVGTRVSAAGFAVLATWALAMPGPPPTRVETRSVATCQTSAQVFVLEHETEYGWTDWGDAFPTGTYMGNMQVCPGGPGWSV